MARRVSITGIGNVTVCFAGDVGPKTFQSGAHAFALGLCEIPLGNARKAGAAQILHGKSALKDFQAGNFFTLFLPSLQHTTPGVLIHSTSAAMVSIDCDVEI